MTDFLFEGWVSPTPMQNKKAVVMMGRMNPPTAGHLYVIGKMWSYAQKNKLVPIVIVVSGAKSSQDKSKNPLDAETRISYLKSAIPSANGMKFMICDGGGPKAFEAVREAGFEPYAVAAGSDRAPGYIKILDDMFLGSNNEKLEHQVMPGLQDREDPPDDGTENEDMLQEIENGAEPQIHMISGSMARLAVKLRLKKAFAKILGVSEKTSSVIFDKVKRALDSDAEEKAAVERAKAEKQAAKKKSK